MPTVGQPQIFHLPDESQSYAQAGQGLGTLLAALIQYYQRQTPGPHQTPTPEYPEHLRFPSGATTPTSPQELSAIQSAGGVPTTAGTVAPLRTGFRSLLPGKGVSYQPPSIPDMARQLQQSQLQKTNLDIASAPQEQEKVRQEARRLRAQADLYEKAAKGEITFQTLPDGTVVPVVPTTSGPKMNQSDEKSARDAARAAEFNTVGTQAPADLPDPSVHPEGTVIRDTTTNKRYRKTGGAWIPL